FALADAGPAGEGLPGAEAGGAEEDLGEARVELGGIVGDGGAGERAARGLLPEVALAVEAAAFQHALDVAGEFEEAQSRRQRRRHADFLALLAEAPHDAVGERL